MYILCTFQDEFRNAQSVCIRFLYSEWERIITEQNKFLFHIHKSEGTRYGQTDPDNNYFSLFVIAQSVLRLKDDGQKSYDFNWRLFWNYKKKNHRVTDVQKVITSFSIHKGRFVKPLQKVYPPRVTPP